MEVTVTVMIYTFVIVTFSSSHGGSHFYESLMVGVRVHSLISTPHELSQTNTSGIVMSLHASFSLPFSHDSLSAGPPGLPLQLVSEQTLREQSHGMKVHFEATSLGDSAVFHFLRSVRSSKCKYFCIGVMYVSRPFQRYIARQFSWTFKKVRPKF